ncbi:MAG: hypothetical protein WC121_14420 [Candidatus Kapaibacterium sp.]
MKLLKKKSLTMLTLIITGLLFLWLSPLKIVNVIHGTFFYEDYYYYMINIYEESELYFQNVNKNEMSFKKITPPSVANESEWFLTFQDSIKIFITTENSDTNKTIPLDKYTVVKISPTLSHSIIESSSDGYIGTD